MGAVLDGSDEDVDAEVVRLVLDYQARSPCIDNNDFDNYKGWDDVDAALAYLNSGGKLLKLPDAMQSAYWRLYTMDAPEEEDELDDG